MANSSEKVISQKIRKEAQIRLRINTRRKLDLLAHLEHRSISDQVDKMVDDKLAGHGFSRETLTTADNDPLVRLGPGGDFVRDIRPKDL